MKGARPVEDFLALARLTDAGDGPERWRAAHGVLVEHPDLARRDVHAAAALGDRDALRTHLEREPALAGATREAAGWTALMCLTCARVPQRDADGSARLLLDGGRRPGRGVLLDGLVPRSPC